MRTLKKELLNTQLTKDDISEMQSYISDIKRNLKSNPKSIDSVIDEIELVLIKAKKRNIYK